MNESHTLINELGELLSSEKLRPYQRSAIDATIDAFLKGRKKIMLELATGTGKTRIMIILIKFLLEQKLISRVLYLSYMRAEVHQTAHRISNYNKFTYATRVKEYHNDSIMITTYKDFLNNISGDMLKNFDLVICNDVQFTQDNRYDIFFSESEAFFVGVTSSTDEHNKKQHWFKDAYKVYKYNTEDAINDGYINPQIYNESIGDFAIRLFQYLGYNNIELEVAFKSNGEKTIRPDLVIRDNNNLIIAEIKAYKGRYNSKSTINNALNQILSYKHIIESAEKPKEIKLFLIFLCEVNEEVKKIYFKEHNINIWDISNLIYICQENRELMNMLTENLSYAISDILPIYPQCGGNFKSVQHVKTKETEAIREIERFEKEIRDCKPGKANKAADKYEKICTDIIKYLFESEFTKICYQHKTGDDIFRMDLLCGLKGAAEFWKFLIRHYNTKFVVFEYKNYGSLITQNLVYITEKYLFNAALRNVAIIISRKGFDKNAQKAAIGCLKENGKLIIDLTDEDLISMLRLKVDGEEPSDYLLSKVEDLLMSVSK